MNSFSTSDLNILLNCGLALHCIKLALWQSDTPSKSFWSFVKVGSKAPLKLFLSAKIQIGKLIFLLILQVGRDKVAKLKATSQFSVLVLHIFKGIYQCSNIHVMPEHSPITFNPPRYTDKRGLLYAHKMSKLCSNCTHQQTCLLASCLLLIM